jgi:hypothetical protein
MLAPLFKIMLAYYYAELQNASINSLDACTIHRPYRQAVTRI